MRDLIIYPSNTPNSMRASDLLGERHQMKRVMPEINAYVRLEQITSTEICKHFSCMQHKMWYTGVLIKYLLTDHSLGISNFLTRKIIPYTVAQQTLSLQLYFLGNNTLITKG